MPVDLIIATLSGEPSTRGFEPTGKELPLAVRLTGTFHTAFPEGKPKPMGAPDDQKKQEAKAKKEEPGETQIKQSAEENSVVLVSDVDLLTDNAAVDVQELFGQRVVIPRNGNLALAQGLVEQLAGDDALISLRSRAAFSRPLTVVRQMEAQAQQQYLGKIKELEDSLNQTQEKLQSLQKAGGNTSATILTAEQQAELDNFRKKAVETRLALKQLRKDLRLETDRLELWTKLANIALIPLLVALAGLLLALTRRSRTRAT